MTPSNGRFLVPFSINAIKNAQKFLDRAPVTGRVEASALLECMLILEAIIAGDYQVTAASAKPDGVDTRAAPKLVTE